jgi:hypothetical protein
MLAVTRTFAVKSTPRYLLMCEEHGALTFTLMTFIQVYKPEEPQRKYFVNGAAFVKLHK